MIETEGGSVGVGLDVRPPHFIQESSSHDTPPCPENPPPDRRKTVWQNAVRPHFRLTKTSIGSATFALITGSLTAAGASPNVCEALPTIPVSRMSHKPRRHPWQGFTRHCCKLVSNFRIRFDIGGRTLLLYRMRHRREIYE